MSKYKDNFTLNRDDIELIEQALESWVSRKLQPSGSAASPYDKDSATEIKRIRSLLGKLHNQKIFYSQANPAGVPLG